MIFQFYIIILLSICSVGVLSASSDVIELNAGNFEKETQANSGGKILSMNFFFCFQYS